jgi:hypothetical protein
MHLRVMLLSTAVVIALTGCGSTDRSDSLPRGSATHDDSTPTAPAAKHHRNRQQHAHPKPKPRKHHPRPKAVYVAGVPAVDLPNPTLTPGAILTRSAARVCVSGYASSVRDVPESESEAVYARYGVPHVPYQQEVDHLVSLELGGSNAITNLWPEPYAGRWGARTKDVLENRLHDLVCAGTITLAYAQRIEAHNWVFAYRRYVGTRPASSGSGGSGSDSSGSGTGSASGSGNCTPSYSPCLVDHGGADYDCYGGSGNGPYYTAPGVVYTVSGSDPYGLDSNRDSRACG